MDCALKTCILVGMLFIYNIFIFFLINTRMFASILHSDFYSPESREEIHLYLCK